ncbi:hypothetical protein N7456_011976 [Penicillium angulare]|uniref:Uncharacterized protein n=1 Tax=Penicillium angulare TaxID=116970 RepID=A0A9W9EV07_9EURO|nr:hypothetical protein N7456_011976 [Penicillium angulare]
MTVLIGDLLQDRLLLRFAEVLRLCVKINAHWSSVGTNKSVIRLISTPRTIAEWTELENAITEFPDVARTMEFLIEGDISVVHDMINCIKCFWPLMDLVDSLPRGPEKAKLMDAVALLRVEIL